MGQGRHNKASIQGEPSQWREHLLWDHALWHHKASLCDWNYEHASWTAALLESERSEPAKNITISEYKHVLKDTLLPEGRRLFASQGLSSSTFQQDNDPTHKRAAASALQEWNATNPTCTVTLLPEWPPNSPDLSPIENLWGYVQAKVDAVGCKDFQEFKQTVVQTLANTPQSVFVNLFNSMKSRVSDCIQLGGCKTKY